MARALRAWAINRGGKNSVRNLRYGPRTRLVRGIYIFLRVVPYFGSPNGLAKIQTTSENSQRYYTTKRRIRDLLSNTPNCYVRGGELREYLFTGECLTEVCEAERNWRG